MKKIYSILLSAVALLSFVPVAQALDDDPPYILSDVGLAYSKKISPPEGGKYIITLESFVTGSVVIQNKSIPADIVLVLDKSGSMAQDYNSNIYTLAYASDNTSVGYRYSSAAFNNPNDSQKRYYKFENNYYQVYRGREDTGTTGSYGQIIYDYYLYFTVNGTTYYLDGTEITTTMPAGKYQGNNSDIWIGPLYQYNSGDVSKMDALKSAVYAFIEEIDRNDRIDPTTNLPRTERLGNKISIISFSGNNGNQTETSTSNANTDAALTVLGNNKNVNDFTGKNSLRNTVRQLGTGGGTYVEHGTELAKGIITGSTSTADVKTVVLFTDGIPGDGSWGNVTGNDQSIISANRAIDDANTMKASNVIIWSVGVFQGMTGNDLTRTNRYMSRVSSDYGSSAPHMDNTDDISTRKYYQDVTTGDLTEVFKTIAESSGGSSIELGAETVAEVDVVSKSFTLPEGGKPEDITVWVASCTGKEGDYLTFGPETKTSIVPTLDKTDDNLDKYDIIEVKGFDYSANWCGYNESTKKYQGQKLIVKIPVMMDENAVGGPDIETNAPGSGIFIEGQDEPLVEFVSPVVSLPVNMHIRKEGLKVGESAKFTIQRQQKGTSTWEDVSSIFVTRHSGQAETGENAPVTKVKGLPSVTKVNNATVEYIYRVREDDWSWSYTLSRIYGTWYDAETDTSREVDMTSKGYGYSTDINQNPFIFVNIPKTDIDKKVRHAESKVTNTFKDGGGAAYDDSKSNGREVITVTASSSSTTESD